MADQYTLNFTDPQKGTFLVNPFTSNGVVSPVLDILAPSAVAANTCILFYGRGHPNYGERTEENLLHLLEHFDGPTPPVNPIAGQLWSQSLVYYREVTGSPAATTDWWLWDGATWNTISVTESSLPITPVVGAYYFDSGSLWHGVTVESNTVWLEKEFTQRSGDPTSPLFYPERTLRAYNPDTTSWENTSKISTQQPANPTTGQLWYDTGTPELMVWTGTVWESVTGGLYLPLSGGTMTGFLTLNADPTSGLHAATKQYVDTVAGGSGIGIFVRLDGDTMTGVLQFTGAGSPTGVAVDAGNNLIINVLDPVDSQDAATKNYVDTMGTVFPLLASPTGTAGAPAYSFSGNSNTGMYRDTSDTINFSTAGVDRFEIDATSVDTTVPLRGPNGSVGTPTYSFTSDTSTGVWRSAGGTLNVSATGVEILEIDSVSVDSTVPIRSVDGSIGIPSYSFINATDTGMSYDSGSPGGNLTFSIGGTERLRIEENGTLSVAGTLNYELLVTDDDDIPNKRYVDNAGDGVVVSGTYIDGIPASVVITFAGSPVIIGSPYEVTGLSNDTTVYHTIVIIDSVPYVVDVVGQDAQTFDQLIEEINIDLQGAGLAVINGVNQIVISSKTIGADSNASIVGSPTGLFEALNGFVSIGAPGVGTPLTISLTRSVGGPVSFTVDHTHDADDIIYLPLPRLVDTYAGSPMGGSPLQAETPVYTVGSHRLWVFVNGVKYILGDGYIENGATGYTSTSITWITPPGGGDRVELIVV